MAYTDEVLQAAHAHSAGHEPEIKESQNCGCFYCKATFPRGEVQDWVDDDPRTALCARCGIDSVLGDASGYDVRDPAFLEAMHEYWFERSVSLAEGLRQIRQARRRAFFQRLWSWISRGKVG